MYLVLSILASTLIFIIFKLFDTFKINTLQAIVVNYFVACLSGIIAYDHPVIVHEIVATPWFYGALILGIIFITVFNLMAITTQRNGLSVAAVAGKMSVAIPVLIGIFVYHESTGIIKIFGILLALIAVYLTAMKKTSGISIERKNLIFPILVFIGSGVIDASLKFFETNYLGKEDVPIFSASVFAFAALMGFGILIYKWISKNLYIKGKNILGGIVLGVVNYFSIYFIIQALRNPTIDSSTIFTLNNVAILLISTFAGILFFKEKLIPRNWIGIALAIISIVMVSFAI